MYNDTIKAENKIISSEDLTQIFQLMGETLKKYLQISEQEERENMMLICSYQKYTFKDSGSKMRVIVDFYDNTNITFDSYDSFMGIFYSRIQEIKSIDIFYSLNYTVMVPEPNKKIDNYNQTIHIYITENKMEIALKLKNDDSKLEDIYNLIKSKVLNAPLKYDDIVKKRSKIINVVSLGIGIIPGMIISAIMLFIPILNKIFFDGYVVYPICSLLLGYLIGNVIASSKLDKYYDSIVPPKKYIGLDSDFKEVYKDDVDSFVGTSEILIGKKVNNLEYREKIKNVYDKYKRMLPREIIVLMIGTLVVIVIGIFMKL